MAQILVFGASTAYGAWGAEGGWVQRLRKFIDERIIASNYELYHVVYNLGISGDTTDGVLARFENETKPRLWEGEENIFLFSIGINDSMYVHATGTTRSTPQEYRGKLKELFDLAKKYSGKIVFVGSFPVDSRVDPISWLAGHSYKNEYIEQFNKAAQEVCEKERVGFVDVYHKFIDTEYEKLLADGVHPNSEGHRLIFETVRDYLLKEGIIEI